jgi:hypothetical protein
VGTETRVFGGRENAKVFQADLGQGVVVEFRFITADDMPPFYAMTTKVSRELFALYDPGTLEGMSAEDRKVPVTDVSFEKAKKFAEWLGVRLELTTVQLPTDEQWKWLADRREPPAPPWERPGYGLKVTKPLPLDRPGNKDVSDQGCLDAYSNGREWTRTILGPAAGRPWRILKGKSYTAQKPFLPEDSLDSSPGPKNDLGFRVVVELPER